MKLSCVVSKVPVQENPRFAVRLAPKIRSCNDMPLLVFIFSTDEKCRLRVCLDVFTKTQQLSYGSSKQACPQSHWSLTRAEHWCTCYACCAICGRIDMSQILHQPACYQSALNIQASNCYSIHCMPALDSYKRHG